MDDVLAGLTAEEKKRIMAVMNRDEKLRDQEKERVTRLGVDLVKERRHGALVADATYSGGSHSRCARCLSDLPATARFNKAGWRCRVCKHLTCKFCRVVRKLGSFESTSYARDRASRSEVAPQSQDNSSIDERSADEQPRQLSSKVLTNLSLSVTSRDDSDRIFAESSAANDAGCESSDSSARHQKDAETSLFSMSVFRRPSISTPDSSKNHASAKAKYTEEVNSKSSAQTSSSLRVVDSREEAASRDSSCNYDDTPLDDNVSVNDASSKMKPLLNYSYDAFNDQYDSTGGNKSSLSSSHQITTSPSRINHLKAVLTPQTQNIRNRNESPDAIRRFLSLAGVEVPPDYGTSKKTDNEEQVENESKHRKSVLTSTPNKSRTNYSPFEVMSRLFASSTESIPNSTTSGGGGLTSAIKKKLKNTSLTQRFRKSLASPNSTLNSSSMIEAEALPTGVPASVSDDAASACDEVTSRSTVGNNPERKTYIASELKETACYSKADNPTGVSQSHGARDRGKSDPGCSRCLNMDTSAVKVRTHILVRSEVETYNQNDALPNTRESSKADHRKSSPTSAKHEKDCLLGDESGFSSDLSDISAQSRDSSDAIAGDVDDSDVARPQELLSRFWFNISNKRNLFCASRTDSHVLPNHCRSNLRKRGRRTPRRKPRKKRLPDTSHSAVVSKDNPYDKRNSTMSSSTKEDVIRVTPESTSPQKTTTEGERQERASLTLTSTLSLAFGGLSKIIRQKEDPLVGLWVCRVCNKQLDFQKKTGNWFHKSTKSSVLLYKQQLFESSPLLNRSRSSTNATSNDTTFHYSSYLRERSISSMTTTTRQLSEPFSTRRFSDISSHEYLRLPVALPERPRSQTLHSELCSEGLKASRLESQARKMSRRTVAEAVHANLLEHLPDVPASSNEPKFVKKQSLKKTQSCLPALVKNGPKDSVVVRGKPISLSCLLEGTPPLKVVWRKGRNEIRDSKQCSIETDADKSTLSISRSARDDSGCYTLQVSNRAGVDQFSTSVKVVDVPDPPGKPHADVSGKGMVVSWYGSGYDGGSTVKEYLLEMAPVPESKVRGRIRWSKVVSTNSTSHTISSLKQDQSYQFRVSAKNEFGLGKPGPVSDPIRHLAVVENGNESTDDEDDKNFFKYEPVEIKKVKFSSQYETKEKLGQGRFGKVHRVIHRQSGKEYAAKIMRALKAKDKEAVSLEIDIMNQLRHPKLVQLIDAYQHDREITMVMDLVAGGELFERVIDEDFEFTEAACIKYMRQICAGVRYMHDCSIVHLDLKPENIMCINKTGTKIKLIDFGLARRFNPREPIRVMFGTPEFVAPEVINYDTIGFQTDMWSVGVICYILLSGLSPFSGDADSETLSNITAVQWDFEDEAFDQISSDAKDFISKLLVKSLKARFTVDKALEHRWLKKDTEKMSKSKLDTKNLKRFLARRKWQKTGNAVRALGRLASLARLTPSASGSNGQQRESGFLSALRAQLVREKEDEQISLKAKPEFVETFDDVEVIEGSAAKFTCVISGDPDPEVMWYQDGRAVKESRHLRISYTEDDVCSLLITETTERDEAEYTCKAVNSEGEASHSAELIVITPGL